MKWVPLNDKTLRQLRQKGYTHLVIKNIANIDELESDKDYVTLEAIICAEETLPPEMFSLTSDLTETFVNSSNADYYVAYK